MSELRRLRKTVNLDLDAGFLSADDPRGLFQFNPETETEIVAAEANLDGLAECIDSIMKKTMSDGTQVDRNLVFEVHRCLPLTRRQAADKRVWAWLGLVRFPHFVAWRWAPSPGSGLRTQERFAGGAVRQTFARLWWAAELTRSGSDYGLTTTLFGLSGIQDIYEAVFGRAFCQYRPALKGFVEVMGQQPESLIRETAKEFGYVLTTLVLETMSEAAIRSLLQDIAEKVRLRSAS
jgi:hypothetical protein